MFYYKIPITILTAVFFFLSQLPYIPNANAKRYKKLSDPYAKFSNEKLVEMAQKDYDTAIKYAKAEGIIKSEEDVFSIIAKAQREWKGIDKKSFKALKKRGMPTKPSDFIGPTRAKKIKEAGLDLDNVSVGEGDDASFMLQSFFHKDAPKEEMLSSYRKAIRFLASLFISNAYARETRTRTVRSTNSSRSVSNRAYDRAGRQATTRAVTRDASPRNYTTNPEDFTRDRMSDQELAAIEEMYSQPTMEDAWLKAQANRQKGYKDLKGQAKQKRGMGMMLLAAGALLVALGFAKMMKGEQDIKEGKKKIQEGQQKLSEAQQKKMQALPMLASPTPATQLKGQQLMLEAQGLEQQGKQKMAEGQSQVEQGKQEKQTGMMMMMAGAGLIMMGLKMLGEAAAMEDEMKEQERKNKEIDDARRKLMEKEEQKRKIKEKILKYRMRTRQIQEEEAQRERDRMQEEAQQIQDAVQRTR